MDKYYSPNELKYKYKYTEKQYKEKYESKPSDYYWVLTNADGIELYLDKDYIQSKMQKLVKLDELYDKIEKSSDEWINAISEIRGSLSVESVHSSRSLVKKIMEQDTFSNEKEQNIKNLVNAYNLTKELDITKENIKKVYDVLVQGIDMENQQIDGEYYRKGEVEIGNIAEGIKASQVNDKMDELIDFINSNLQLSRGGGYSKVIKLVILNSLVHYQFIYIHPYYDRNGRMTRIIAQWHSDKISNVFNYIPISEVIAYDKTNYYRAIQNVRDSYKSMDVTYFVDYILEKIILYTEVELLVDENIKVLQNKLEVISEKEKGYIRLIYLSELRNRKFGYKDFNQFLKIDGEEKTKQGAFKILNNLTEKGVLVSYIANDKRTKLYSLAEEFKVKYD